MISSSGNIALYPSLVCIGAGELACAWYEYSAPDRPARSDVWFAMTSAGIWGSAIRLPGGNSYNNGPSLVWSAAGNYVLAWHSWRIPGKDPFTVDDDICNIWVSCSSDGRQWSAPEMAFPQVSNTEYATVARDPASRLWMVFVLRTSHRLHISHSCDGIEWSEPIELPQPVGKGKHPDLHIDVNGRFYLAYVVSDGARDVIWLSTSSDGLKWLPGSCLYWLDDAKLSRPKVSTDMAGDLWLTCHTNHWGSFASEYRLLVSADRLNIRFSATTTPGNAFWVLSALEIQPENGGAKQLYRFGPHLPDGGAGIWVNSADCLYDAGRGYGFDGALTGMLRELGDSLTRTLVCANEARTFTLALAPGEYRVKVVYSSWIASAPGTQIQFDAQILQQSLPQVTYDECYVLRFKRGLEADALTRLNEGANYDNNRPSKVVFCPSQRKAFIAWSQYWPDRVGIELRELA